MFKGRDPASTRTIRFPWKPDDPCPCGSEFAAQRCCLQTDGCFYRRPRLPVAPSPVTGFENPHCYMRHTRDCSRRLSGEHFVSASVLKVLGPEAVGAKGMPWQRPNEAKAIPISRLRANILCQRHNTAMSSLDSCAAEFFRALRTVYDNVANTKSLSRRALWYLISGEELEMWFAKTALGLFHSNTMPLDRGAKRAQPTIRPSLHAIFRGRILPEPCGLYLQTPSDTQLGKRNELTFRSVVSDNGAFVVGLEMVFMGATFSFLFDTGARFRGLEEGLSRRPDCLRFRNAQRSHTIVLTWPKMQPRNMRMLVYTKTPLT